MRLSRRSKDLKENYVAIALLADSE